MLKIFASLEMLVFGKNKTNNKVLEFYINDRSKKLPNKLKKLSKLRKTLKSKKLLNN